MTTMTKEEFEITQKLAIELAKRLKVSYSFSRYNEVILAGGVICKIKIVDSEGTK